MPETPRESNANDYDSLSSNDDIGVEGTSYVVGAVERYRHESSRSEEQLRKINQRRNYGATSTSAKEGENVTADSSLPPSVVNTSKSSKNIPSSSSNPNPGNNSNLSSIDSTTEGSSSTATTVNGMSTSLNFFQKLGYGLGHVYNDLCAAVWFSYTLLFMQASLTLPAPEAGALVMLGQVSDAIATPIVGLLADKIGTKRKWHIFGTGLVFLSFPMIFSLCPFCKTAPLWWPPTYFSIFIILFQFAWAVVQITHLAMIPEIAMTTKDRADLTATRYSASVCSNLVVYVITWVILHDSHQTQNKIGPSDAYKFRDISLILTLIGLTMSIVFHFSLSYTRYDYRRMLSSESHRHLTRRNSTASIESNHEVQEERTTNRISSERDPLLRNVCDTPSTNAENSNSVLQRSEDDKTKMKRKNFLKSPRLYQNALLYVFSRLYMTTSLVYMPLWLDERAIVPQPTTPTAFVSSSSYLDALNEDSDQFKELPSVEHLATVPLVCFLASFVSSILLKNTNQWLTHKIAYLIGTIISVSGCVYIAYAQSDSFTSYKLYMIAILFGAGSSITMISSLCITADMIGKHTYQGGFIYSTVTFADKLITGIVVMIIENMKCKNRANCPEYYRYVLSYGCGIAAVLGFLTLLTLMCNKRAVHRSRTL